MATLYILCGPAGSGKSTWAKGFMEETARLGGKAEYVSRDKIRLTLLEDDEEYFTHEIQVYKKFVSTIQDNLMNGIDVVADATHLTKYARRRLLTAIDMKITDYEIVMVAFDGDPDRCVARNSAREGRAHVPENVIRNMCRDYRPPTLEEDSRIIEVKVVEV